MNNSELQTESSGGKKKLWPKILFYIFLFPIAITIYIVKNKKMSKTTKAVLLGLVWIFCLGIFISRSSNDKKAQSNPSTVGQVTIEEKNNEKTESENGNEGQSVNENKDKEKDTSKNPMKLSFGDTYDNRGINVTLESLEKLDDAIKLKVKIKNDSSETYHLSDLQFECWTMDDVMLTYVSTHSSDTFSFKDINPGESFEGNVFRQSGDVSYVTYAINSRDHRLNPLAKWIITEDTRAQAEKDEESKNASQKAQEAFKNLMPYPDEITFPLLDCSVSRVAGEFYQYGHLKYKNAYGNKVKEEYRMWYKTDGTLTKAELGDKILK